MMTYAKCSIIVIKCSVNFQMDLNFCLVSLLTDNFTISILVKRASRSLVVSVWICMRNQFEMVMNTWADALVPI